MTSAERLSCLRPPSPVARSHPLRRAPTPRLSPPLQAVRAFNSSAYAVSDALEKAVNDTAPYIDRIESLMDDIDSLTDILQEGYDMVRCAEVAS